MQCGLCDKVTFMSKINCKLQKGFFSIIKKRKNYFSDGYPYFGCQLLIETLFIANGPTFPQWSIYLRLIVWEKYTPR